ncbi:MAG: ribonuclease HII [Deltaproteobacteria bacterium]|nr:ribonuclease HII [Deltaproteobacteria bacterium]
MDQYEKEAHSKGFLAPAGVDEAGRGPLAGPVVAAAVILPFPPPLDIGFKDSKKLTQKARERLVMEVFRVSRAVGLGLVWPEEIDRVNIHRASLLAMERAVEKLIVRPDILLIDGKFRINSKIEQKTIISGDALSVSIAAASIVAKTTRDAIMASYNLSFPEYRFDRHKGYGTREHMDAIDEHGAASMHRKTFRGVMKDLFSGTRGNSDG